MKAIVLFSGGVDSTVSLAIALKSGRECYPISFDYGQRHKIELESAKKIAAHYGLPHKIIKIDPATFANTALIDLKNVPKNRTEKEIDLGGIPSTYVPARNTLFLSYALGQAEIVQAEEIYFGPNALDIKPYPDCRPAFISAFQQVMNVATKQAVDGAPPRLVTPLIEWNKTEIIREGIRLHAPLELTFSCYDPTPMGQHCTQCDACLLRQKGFAENS